jgi:hypothetical protein
LGAHRKAEKAMVICKWHAPILLKAQRKNTINTLLTLRTLNKFSLNMKWVGGPQNLIKFDTVEDLIREKKHNYNYFLGDDQNPLCSIAQAKTVHATLKPYIA